MGGAGLADTMLYCRDKIYPLGLPNSMAHVLTGIALLAQAAAQDQRELPAARSQPLNVSVSDEDGMLSGRFSLLAVTTLEKLLLSSSVEGQRRGALKLLAVEERRSRVLRVVAAIIGGKLGRRTSAECISRKPTKSPSRAKART